MATDPWTILAEARKIVALAASRDPRFDDGLLSRIDAAFAGRAELNHKLWWQDDEPNAWGHCSQHSVSDEVGAGSMQDCIISVTPSWRAANGWSWRVDYRGNAKTEDEAKATALAVAERIR